MPSRLRNYTDEEIDILLNGDRREVDKLLLHGISAIGAVLVPHIEKEEAIFDALGDVPTIHTRSRWIEAQITKQQRYNGLMQKIIDSSVLWVIPLVLAFVIYAVGDQIVDVIRAKLAAQAVTK